jgi:hypothetical protein
MAGIAQGAEWIDVKKLRELIGQVPDDSIVQASPLGNLVVYDTGGPLDGKMIAYIDLYGETLEFSSEEPPEQASPN